MGLFRGKLLGFTANVTTLEVHKSKMLPRVTMGAFPAHDKAEFGD